jgi:hypothetical protein
MPTGIERATSCFVSWPRRNGSTGRLQRMLLNQTDGRKKAALVHPSLSVSVGAACGASDPIDKARRDDQCILVNAQRQGRERAWSWTRHDATARRRVVHGSMTRTEEMAVRCFPSGDRAAGMGTDSGERNNTEGGEWNFSLAQIVGIQPHKQNPAGAGTISDGAAVRLHRPCEDRWATRRQLGRIDQRRGAWSWSDDQHVAGLRKFCRLVS